MFVPHAAFLVEVIGPYTPPPVFPEEAAALGDVSSGRKLDFASGRDCARRALIGLGDKTRPILRGDSREPIWPDGVCGSITHCEGYTAAAVARHTELLSIGIDAEPRRPLAEGVLKLIASEEEIRQAKAARHVMPWELLLFSAKESVFKAWFPIMKVWLGFEQVQVAFISNTNRYRVTIKDDVVSASSGIRAIEGYYEVAGQHVFTSAYIEARKSKRPLKTF